MFGAHKHIAKLIHDFGNPDFQYQYVSGVRNLTNVQVVYSNSDVLPTYTFFRNELMLYKRIGKRGNWATRFRVGLATNHASPFAPFVVQNNLNIRGVGELIDRGTGSIVLNTEYRHTLLEKGWFVIQGNAFLDIGSWRLPGGDIDDFVASQNTKAYPGLGLRFMHKRIFNAIFRIDYGYGISSDQGRGFVFGIGQYF